MRKRRVVILGATGSIGESTRKVARDIPERMGIVGMSAHSNEEKLRQAGQDFPSAKLALSSGADGVERLVELATLPEADLVLIAIVGTAGLRPALAAIEAGKDIAVASKEILVMAGEAVMGAARRKGVKVLPVDSEHNAIFQCLEGRSSSEVRRLILTASGGPFRKWPVASLAGVTPDQALKHPTWNMGAKITVDSATLFNKGLEMIEARWLFDVEMARVEVIVHPQSIVHSMVEFIDSSVLAQLSVTDMCFPIQYAVTWPERVPNSLPPLDFAKLAKLDFEAPRLDDFPALNLARWAGETGGTLPAVLNAANEVAVAAFLRKHCGFPAIWETVEQVMRQHRSVAGAGLDAILAADTWARTRATELLFNHGKQSSTPNERLSSRRALSVFRGLFSLMIILHILKIILIILEVLVIFNLMIIVHELGHFLAARWRGLVIEKFGIWFGKPLWKKKINGVEYSLGSIPAGGFVALPQLAPMEVMEGQVETPRDQLPPISVLDKIIVAFAGPLFSFLLAVVFAIIIWQCGRPVSEPESSTTVGYIQEKSPAAEAQMQVGDKILSVDGHPVTRFQGMSTDSIAWSVVRSEGEKVSIVVKRDVNGKKETKDLWVAPTIPEKTYWWNRKNLRTIGILPSYSFVVGKVQPGSAADKAGLHIDDVITAINGQKMYIPDDLYEYGKTHLKGPYELTVERPQVDLANGARVRWSDDLKMTKLTVPFDPKGVLIAGVEKESPASAAGLQKGDVVLGIDSQPINFREQMMDYVGSHAGVPVTFHIQRAGQNLDIKITPQVPIGLPPEMEKLGKIGAVLESTDGLAYESMGKSKLIYPHPVEQVRQSVMAIVNTLDAVLSRKSSIGVQQMGGPVMMMNAYYHMLSSPEGIRMAIWFSVILNVNLALLNMLPIPVLDGGHITLAIIEAIRRKPINVRILEYVQTACALVIIGFMLFIMFFDVQDLPFVGGKRPTIHFQKPTEEPAK